jgi:hypothetical protein
MIGCPTGNLCQNRPAENKWHQTFATHPSNSNHTFQRWHYDFKIILLLSSKTKGLQFSCRLFYAKHIGVGHKETTILEYAGRWQSSVQSFKPFYILWKDLELNLIHIHIREVKEEAILILVGCHSCRIFLNGSCLCSNSNVRKNIDDD